MDIWSTIIEIFGAIAGLIYLYLEIKQRRTMWIVGAVSALVYIFVFFRAGLYAAMAFQFYYVWISIYGWRRWSTDEYNVNESDTNSCVTVKMPAKVAVISAITIVFASLLFWQILRRIDSDPMPFADGFVVALSMVATYWVSNKYIEHWILWGAANSLSVYIYVSQGLYATMVLYILFLAASVVGYIRWRKFRRVLN